MEEHNGDALEMLSYKFRQGLPGPLLVFSTSECRRDVYGSILIPSFRTQHLHMSKTELPSFLPVFSLHMLPGPWFPLHPGKGNSQASPPYLQSITGSSSFDLFTLSWISFLSISSATTALDQICSCLTLIAVRPPDCELPPLWTLQSVFQMWAQGCISKMQIWSDHFPA